jgi:3alpha(or 20beta)-hydroxysteroid dehydrogenase
MNAVAVYSSSKWGLRGLTRSAAIELGRDGIRVNAVCPAMGNPEMSAPWADQIDVERYLNGVPRPKLYRDGLPIGPDAEDAARMVLFLLSEDSRACTGSDFVVDAGWTAGPYCDGLPGF